MKKIIAICCAVTLFAYSQIAWAGTAIGPWVGNQTALESMVYYGGTSYSKAQKSMGAGARWNPDVLATSGMGATVTQNFSLPVGAGAANTALSGYISPAGVLGVFGAVLGGPWGVAALATSIALPAVIDWLALADVRQNSVHTGMERKDPAVCSVAPCFEYRVIYMTDAWQGDPDAACVAKALADNATGGNKTYFGHATSPTVCHETAVLKVDGSYGGQWDIAIQSQSTSPKTASWIPAAYPDYQQRLSGIPVSTALINSLLDAGYTFPLDGPTVTGPATVSAPPKVASTPVPPVPSSSTQTSGGNPYNLANNTPTVTGTVNGTRDVIIDGKTVSIPTKKTTTSTYDPATGATTSITADSSDPHTVTNTTNTTSSQTYGPKVDPSTGQTVPSVTSNTVSSTTTVVTNNTTNNVVSNTTSTQTTPDKSVDPCDANPDRAGCSKFGEPPAAEAIPTKSIPVSVSPVTFAGSGGCPAPITYMMLGRSYTLGYDPMCDLMVKLAPLFLALGAASAAYIFMEGLKP